LSAKYEKLATSRLACQPPSGEANRVTDLALYDNGDGTFTLSWTYKNVGDYNQDGIVDIADITPLAENFLQPASPTNEWIDGNNDGQIDIADIAPLAENFFNEVAGYVIEASPIGGEFAELARAEYAGNASAQVPVLQHILNAGDLGDMFYFRVVAYDGEGNLSDAYSNVVQRPFAPGNPPAIISVTPVAGDSGTSQSLTARIAGDTPIAYKFDFAGGAEPNEITGVIESYEGEFAEITAEVTLTRGGDLLEPTKSYPAKITLTNFAGEASEDIAFTVTAIWHIEEIPKVPGYEEYDPQATQYYDISPDGSLWGVHRYSGSGSKFLIHWDGSNFEYEELPYDKVQFLKVDREGNPAICGSYEIWPDGIGLPTYEHHFARKVNGAWEDEKIEFRAPELLFDSQNRPVIIYKNADQSLWVVRKIGDEWVKTQVREAGEPIFPHAVITADNIVHILFRSEEDGGVLWCRVGEEGSVHELLLQDQENKSYWVIDVTTTASGSGLMTLFSEYDATANVGLDFVGIHENAAWEYQDVALENRRRLGSSVVAITNGTNAVFWYLYDFRTAVIYASKGGDWTKVQEFYWELHGELRMTITPQGDPVIVDEEVIARYW